LTIFEAVMTELNVSRAAEYLQMTQPAVSHALRRLRRITNDELFIKVPSGVSPTPKALEMWKPIQSGLTHIRQALKSETFDPATATQTFTISTADSTAILLLPKLIPYLEQTAPNVNLRIVPNTNINAPSLLEQAEIDIAIGRFFTPSFRLRTQNLYVDSYVCVMRRQHPLASKNLTLARYVEAKHLLISLTGEATGFIDHMLQEKGLKRRIALTVNQFALAPKLIANSDLISVLPLRILHKCGLEEQLHMVPLPIEVAPAIVQIMWHERKQRDPAHEWLRSLLLNICKNL
jgi:DNA-binding transcriptional LysR family regulator